MLLEPPRSDIAERLIDLEAELRQLNLWAADPPTPEALASEQPFAVDTLALEQWLQFIFFTRAVSTARQRSGFTCALCYCADG